MRVSGLGLVLAALVGLPALAQQPPADEREFLWWDSETTISGGPTLLPGGRFRGIYIDADVVDGATSIWDIAILEMHARVWPLGADPDDWWSILGFEVGGGVLSTGSGNLAPHAGLFAMFDLLFRLGPDSGSRFQLAAGVEKSWFTHDEGQPEDITEYHLTARLAVTRRLRLSAGLRTLATRFQATKEIPDERPLCGVFILGDDCRSADDPAKVRPWVDIDTVMAGGELHFRIKEFHQSGIEFDVGVYRPLTLPDFARSLWRFDVGVHYRQAWSDIYTDLLGHLLFEDPERTPGSFQLEIGARYDYYAAQSEPNGRELAFYQFRPTLDLRYRIWEELAAGLEFSVPLPLGRHSPSILLSPSLTLRTVDQKNEVRALSNLELKISATFSLAADLDDPDSTGEQVDFLSRAESPNWSAEVWSRPYDFLELGIIWSGLNHRLNRWKPDRQEWAVARSPSNFVLGPSVRFINVFDESHYRELLYVQVTYQEGIASFSGGDLSRAVSLGLGFRYYGGDGP